MIDRREVTDAGSFASFAKQETGVTFHYQSSFARIGKAYKEFREEFPHAGWPEFAKVVLWAKERRGYRPLNVGQLAMAWPYARDDDVFDSQDLHGFDLDGMVAEALHIEDDPEWRRRLLISEGKFLAQAYEEWKHMKENENEC